MDTDSLYLSMDKEKQQDPIKFQTSQTNILEKIYILSYSHDTRSTKTLCQCLYILQISAE